jgi:hypothetical protein
VTHIFYDTEFVEDGHTIDLVSIGMVRENEELYAIVADDQLIDRVARNPWLTMNVLPHLPVIVSRDLHRTVTDERGTTFSPVKHWEWDQKNPDFANVLPRKAIADLVRRFICSAPKPELWAYFGAYDHVVLCQLFGPIVDLPNGIPMYTHDLKQEQARLGFPALPGHPENAHNALADARWNQSVYQALR